MRVLLGILIILIFSSDLVIGQPTRGMAPVNNSRGENEMINQNYVKARQYFYDAMAGDPDKLEYAYNVGYSFFKEGDYQNAIKQIEPLTRRKDVTIDCYRILGNSYDLQGDYPKAVKLLSDGLEKFPDGGALYLDLGIIEFIRDNTGAALNYWEQGIANAPLYSDNYYWAAKTLLNSNLKVWTVIYGEIFLNLERDSGKYKEVSKMVYDAYRAILSHQVLTDEDQITFTDKKFNGMTNALLNLFAQLESNYGGIFSSEKKIPLRYIHEMRQQFLYKWNEQYKSTYDNVFFKFLNEINNRGYLKEYSYWVTSAGNPDDFISYQKLNQSGYVKFLNYFAFEKYKPDMTRPFVRPYFFE